MLPALMCFAFVVSAIGCGTIATRGSTAGTLYTVSAQILKVAGKPTKACAGVPLSRPPSDCGGVEVVGVDVHAIKGVTVYANGTVETPPVSITGTWDDHKLMVTKRPEIVEPSLTTPLAECSDQGASETLMRLQSRIATDHALLSSKGIEILKTAPCGDHVLVVVPVADAPTID
jgi:hypothetical protein